MTENGPRWTDTYPWTRRKPGWSDLPGQVQIVGNGIRYTPAPLISWDSPYSGVNPTAESGWLDIRLLRTVSPGRWDVSLTGVESTGIFLWRSSGKLLPLNLEDITNTMVLPGTGHHYIVFILKSGVSGTNGWIAAPKEGNWIGSDLNTWAGITHYPVQRWFILR